MHKTGKLQALKPLSALGEFDFTRVGDTATLVNEAGLIETVPANTPRIDFTGGGYGNLLLYPHRVNLLFFSEQFDNSAWSKTDLVINVNSANSPDGTNTSDKVVANSGVIGTLVQFVTVPDSTTFAVSIYAKPSEIEMLSLGFVQKNGAEPGAIFNLKTNSITNFPSSPINAYIEESSNGFKRCVIIINSNSGGTSPRVRIYAPSSIGVGDGVSGFFIWGAQLETGEYATSYIRTTDASVTRGAEFCSKTGINSLIGQTEGTFLLDVAQAFNLDSTFLVQFDDGSNTNRFGFVISNGLAEYFAQVSGMTVSQINAGNVGSIGRYKCALAYSINDYAFAVNGVIVGTDNFAAVPATSQIRFGNDAVGNGVKGARYNGIALFKSRLSNPEIAQLTLI